MTGVFLGCSTYFWSWKADFPARDIPIRSKEIDVAPGLYGDLCEMENYLLSLLSMPHLRLCLAYLKTLQTVSSPKIVHLISLGVDYVLYLLF